MKNTDSEVKLSWVQPEQG